MNWATIVENMPGAKWVVTVHRGSETLATHDVPFTDTVATDDALEQLNRVHWKCLPVIHVIQLHKIRH